MFGLPRPERFTVPTANSEAATRAAELHAEWVAGHERVGTLEAERRQVQAEHEEADQAVKDAAYALESGGGSHKPLDEATARLRAAKDRLDEPWHARIEAAHRVVRDRRGAYGRFVDEHALALLAAFEDKARDVSDRFVEAIDGLLSVAGERTQLAHDVEGVVAYITGLTGRDLAEPPLDLLSIVAKLRDMRSMTDEADLVPKPLPSEIALVQRRELLETGSVQTGVAPIGFRR